MFKRIVDNGSIFIIMTIVNVMLFFLTCVMLYNAWATGEIHYVLMTLLTAFLTLFFTHQNFKNNEK